MKALDKKKDSESGFSAYKAAGMLLQIHKKSPKAPMTMHFLTPILCIIAVEKRQAIPIAR